MRTLGRKAGRAGWLCGIFLFQIAIGIPLAQGAEPGGSSPSASEAAREVAKDGSKDSGPFGGCEPIGLTASGELVFPLECKKMIKKPAEAPVAEDKASADDKTASTDPRSAVPSQAAAADKAAGTEAKPAAGEVATVKPAVPAEPKQAAGTDKPGPIHKAAGMEPAATKLSPIKPSTVKSPSTTSATIKAAKLTATTPSSAKTSSGKVAPTQTVAVAIKETAAKDTPTEETTAKLSAAKSGQTDASKAAGRDGDKTSRTVASRPMIVMAKPATATPVSARLQADDRSRLRTAGLPACVQFRSYNPITRSYRGFDGHIYVCR